MAGTCSTVATTLITSITGERMRDRLKLRGVMSVEKPYVVQRKFSGVWRTDTVPMAKSEAERHLEFERKHHPEDEWRIYPDFGIN